jgi:hypothetical protein
MKMIETTMEIGIKNEHDEHCPTFHLISHELQRIEAVRYYVLLLSCKKGR